jgi:microcystin-dependent protein
MALPPPGYLSDPTRTDSQMKAALEALRDAIASLTGSQPPTALSIASGSVSPTQGDFTVDTEGGAATDDLTNIVPTGLHDGAVIYLRTTDGARDVTVKHGAGGAGQIQLAGGTDATLTDPNQWIQLRLAGSVWQEVARSEVIAIPTGSWIVWPNPALPSGGYLWADGALVSRATYAALFAVYGTRFGAGDGTTTFGLPLVKGRSLFMLDPGDAAFATLGQTGGGKTHTPAWSGSMSAAFTGAPLGAHLHRLPILSAGGPWSYFDNIYGGDAAGAPTQYQGTAPTAATSVRPYSEPVSAGTPAGSVTGTVSGSNGAVQLLNPYIVTNVVIKT